MRKPAAGRQYAIRSVPQHVDRALRRRAKEAAESLNQVALEALIEGSDERTRVYDDLEFLVGSLNSAEAKALDREIAEQRSIDEEL